MTLPKSVFVAFLGLSCVLAATASEDQAEGNQPSPVDPSQQLGPQGSGVPPVGPYPDPYPYLPQGPYPGQYVPQPGPYGPYMPQSGPYGCTNEGCVPYPYPYGPGPYVIVPGTKTKDGAPTKKAVVATHYGSALNGQFLNNLELDLGK